MTREQKDIEFIRLKQEYMDDMGFDEKKKKNDSIESAVNDSAKDAFWHEFGD